MEALRKARAPRLGSYWKDEGFRKWLEKDKNIVPTYLFAFGTPSLIGRYRKEYNQVRK
jgi:hypothetical protein